MLFVERNEFGLNALLGLTFVLAAAARIHDPAYCCRCVRHLFGLAGAGVVAGWMVDGWVASCLP